MFQSPQPCHIDMCMTYNINCHICMFFQTIQFCHQYIMCRIHGLIERIFIPVDTLQCTIQSSFQILILLIGRIHKHQSFRDGTCKIVKFICFFMQISKISLFTLMEEGTMLPSTFQSCPQKEGKFCFLSFFSLEKHLIMVCIYTLIWMSIHIKQRFKSTVISPTCLSKIKQSDYFTAFFCFRKFYFLLKPKITVSSNKRIIDPKRFSFNLFRNFTIAFIYRQSTFHRSKWGNTLITEISSLSKLFYSSLKFVNCKKHNTLLLFHNSCLP